MAISDRIGRRDAAAAGTGRAERRRVTVRGVVQGVGFRPFVWRLAHDHGLAGFVQNTSGGVIIELEGEPRALDSVIDRLAADPPPLARVTSVASEPLRAQGERAFLIRESVAVAGAYQPISPDAATCPDCLAELLADGDRRFRYPFINCTNCGPRFTIIEDVPYDRPLTTMRSFHMCDACRREYDDPANRRFHAQPNACPACGPRMWRCDRQGRELSGDAVRGAADGILRGEIVALKGLGGFQLACDAGDAGAVARLRQRKRRPSKPFALMVVDVDAARRLCRVSEAEAAVLSGTVRPIVLLRRHQRDSAVTDGVAPGLDELGVMLPTTPLHHLLVRAVHGAPLVMTSGNLSEEPIAKANEEALTQLGQLAESFLLHDRDVYARYDDSVVRVDGEATRVLRRARGYCPEPIVVAHRGGDVLSFGAHLKNTFAVTRGGLTFVGPHIGDLDDPLSLGHQAEALGTYLRLFRAEPRTVACDLHPDYASSRLAEEWVERHAIPSPGSAAPAQPVRVQHHHAHVASVMAEHELRGELIGVAFDGAGFGPDGTIWGGEFLVCDERRFTRAGHLAAVRQPGGDLCAREGWRMAVAYLAAAGMNAETPPGWLGPGGDDFDDRRWRLVARLAGGEMAPLTTSAGRLFDAVASLLGVAHTSSYEAEAAVRLETAARRVPLSAITPMAMALTHKGAVVVDTPGLVAALAADRAAGRPAGELAAVFHESLAQAIADVCETLHRRTGLDRVALSGGVFQNALLLTRTLSLLRERELAAFANRLVPANDGGISLGQALVATSRTGGGVDG